MIAGDTGVRHMAIGLHSPTLDIMWILYLTALCYLPKIEQRQVVFNPDYEQSTSNDVYKATQIMTTNLYSENA